MELLTIAEIAKRLYVPESTIRYYRDMFDEFVPTVGTGRRKKYTEESFEVLRFISDSMRAGVPKEEVQGILQQRYPMTIETQQGTAVTQQQGAAIMRQLVADAMQEILQEQAAAYEARIDALERRLDERDNRAEERDRILMQTLRELQSQKKQPLFKRIFGGKKE